MAPSHRPRPRRSARRILPWLERCEERRLLSTVTVLNTADSGPGSLRQAIIDANADPDSTTIDFNFTTVAPTYEIDLQSPLPDITAQVFIDGLLAQNGSPRILLNGGNLAGDGLNLTAEYDPQTGDVIQTSDASTIAGLAIVNFGQAGIHVQSNSNLIIGNFIGTNLSGSASGFGNGTGILIEGGSFNRIGGSSPGDGNLISGNIGDGISLSVTGGNSILGNNIGGTYGDITTPTLIQPLGNGGNGITMFFSWDNQIGASQAGSGNLVVANGAANAGSGIDIDQFSYANVVSGNAVGTTFFATSGIGIVTPNNLGNVGDGILLLSASGNTIGGSTTIGPDGKITSLGGNIVAGNGRYGIDIEFNDPDFEGQPGYGNVVQGNLVGTNATGASGMANALDGILVASSAQNVIGGANTLNPDGSLAVLNGNLVSGNQGTGITLNGSDTTSNLVTGNWIGTNLAGRSPLANGKEGIRIYNGANDNTVGGAGAGSGNLIAGNALSGIRVGDQGTTANGIIGNRIGLDSTGLLALPNLGDGILVESAGNTVGGAASGAGNVVSGNLGAGVRVTQLAAGTQILGNWIGLDATGVASGVGNVLGGVEVQGAAGTTIGGPSGLPGSGAGNVISGNRQAGIHVSGAATATVIQGNIIGLDAIGTTHQGNSLPGVLIDGVSRVVVGGTDSGTGNVISNNGTAGVSIQNGATANQILGNKIGTDVSGTSAAGPIQNGIVISASSANVIGGTDGRSGNLISGNGLSGILISGAGSSGNLVLGNKIGTDIAGTHALANGLAGVEIDSGIANTIGGTAPGSRNLISGNRSHGVEIKSTSDVPQNNVVAGNYIGTTDSGGAKLANAVDGVFLSAGAIGNIIGGTSPGAGNVISGNQSNGVELFSTAAANSVLGNKIGTDFTGSVAVANNNVGVYINNASGNIIGGATATTGGGAGNLISGNNASGLLISGVNATGNKVQGNLIGVDTTGSIPLSNLSAGVTIDSARNNLIGGGEPGTGNVISANLTFGVVVLGTNATGNQIAGNLIGTNASGASNLGNALDGVMLNAAPSNIIGGYSAGDRNVISGNTGNGVEILNISGPSGNIVAANLIGTDPTGMKALGNGRDGMLINGVTGTQIIATALPNVISSNGGDGIHQIGTTNRSVIQGNIIGMNAAGTAALGNASDGIELQDAGANTVGGSATGQGNFISGNGSHGIQIDSPASTSNVIVGNTLGTNIAGTSAVPNNGFGISIEGAANTYTQYNLISGNTNGGIQITGSGATGTVVYGSYIGTDRSGGAAIGNGLASENNGNGIFISGSANTKIGGDGAGQGNLISGNATTGIYIFGRFAAGNVVSGNRIGTDSSGQRPLYQGGTTPIQQVGVLINAAPGQNSSDSSIGAANTVGGVTLGAGNVISGNVVGIEIAGSDSQGNVVAGNLIGPTATGGDGAGNTIGVYINGAPGNVVGGALGNTISGNSSVGVYILGNASVGNLVTGNFIGVAPDGVTRLPNQSGVYIENAPRNIIGGTTVADQNVISGNTVTGVYIVASQSVGNVVKGNLIGYAADGKTRLGTGQYGVLLYNAPANNIVRRGANANRITGAAIASFREFTGRPVSANAPLKNNSLKVSGGGRATRSTHRHAVVVGHAKPGGPIRHK